jgi:diadenosine tetraphosphate (Ap4A) HIT family hydrolase
LTNCPLCKKIDYPIIWENNLFRLVLINDQKFPGYCRLETIEHIKELSDLEDNIQVELIKKIIQIEKVLRDLLNPDKINIASLGNVTPHLHWHIIPRYRKDSHFPNSIWSEALRAPLKEFNAYEEKSFINKCKAFLD